MEYPVHPLQKEGGEVPFMLREIIIDLKRLTFVQIEQSSQDQGEDGQGCSMLVSGHKGAIEMPLSGAEKLRDTWLSYHGHELSDGKVVSSVDGDDDEGTGELLLVAKETELPE